MVYEPSEDTFFLLDNIKPEGKILEMGAGSGYISIELAKKGYDVYSVDIDDESIQFIKKEAEKEHVKINIIKSNLFENVKGEFDTIIFNPPYLPGNPEEDRTIYGGERGQEIIVEFLKNAGKYLKDNGKIYLIMSSFNDIEGIIKKFRQYDFKEIARKNFFFHSIFLYEITKRKD